MKQKRNRPRSQKRLCKARSHAVAKEEVRGKASAALRVRAASQWGRRRGLLLGRAAPWAWGQLLPHVRCHFPTAALQTAHLFVRRVFYPRHTEGLAQPAHVLARDRILFFAHRTRLFDARRRAVEEPPLHPRTCPRTRPIRLASPQVLTPPTFFPLPCPVARRKAAVEAAQASSTTPRARASRAASGTEEARVGGESFYNRAAGAAHAFGSVPRPRLLANPAPARYPRARPLTRASLKVLPTL